MSDTQGHVGGSIERTLAGDAELEKSLEAQVEAAKKTTVEPALEDQLAGCRGYIERTEKRVTASAAALEALFS